MLTSYRFSSALFALLIFPFLISLVFSGHALAGQNHLNQVSGNKDLEKVRRSKFSETYVKAGVDFSFYNTIYVDETRFAYRGVTPEKKSGGNYSNSTSKVVYPVSKEDRQLFEKIVRDVFRTEVAKGTHFEIVDILNTDEHTLVMRGMVADIVFKVPPESVERTRLYMSSVGSATLELEFRDNSSREVLARVAERGLIGDSTDQANGASRPVNRATVIDDVKRWATNAAIKLRNVLDSALEG